MAKILGFSAMWALTEIELEIQKLARFFLAIFDLEFGRLSVFIAAN